MDLLKEIIKKRQDGVTLNISVIPESHAIVFPAGINKWRKCIEIKVKSPAVDNRANNDVIETIANFFKKSVQDVIILTGGKNTKKIVFVKGVTVGFVSDKMRESLNGL